MADALAIQKPAADKDRDGDDRHRARDILTRQSQMESDRRDNEYVWEQVSDYCDPDGASVNWRSRIGGESGNRSQALRAEERSRLVYDSTISSASDRLSAGLESLITPQSDKWHGISTAAMNDEETEDEREWGENLANYLFNDVRYSAASHFVPAIQSCYLNVVRYGPAYLYAEEGFGSAIIRYSSVPINEAYIQRNRWGEPDIYHRLYQRTARQCAQMFGYNKLPAKIKMLVDDPTKSMQLVSLIQAVEPRNERKMYTIGDRKEYLDSEYASYHVIEGEEVIVREKSFNTFPVSCFNWRRHEGDTYGVSPCIKALTTVREVNAVRRTGLRALQQLTDPATASTSTMDEIPMLNPGQNYPGMMSEEGRMLIAPINTGANPQYAFEYAATQTEVIRDMLYVNLFQVLVNNPQQTATEALIRQEEKGALLGPAGSIIQRGFASNLDREMSILEMRGLYDPDSRFLPPESLAGKPIRPTFTSPLDTLRRASEARDTIQLLTTAMQLATVDPTVMDGIIGDEVLQVIRGAGRAPQRIFRKVEERDKMRAERAQAQQAQQGMAALGGMAKTISDTVPMAKEMRESGMVYQQGTEPSQ